MKTSDIVLSAASVASALSALGHLGNQGIQVEVTSTAGKFMEQAGAAVAASQAQREIRAQIPNIASTVKLDGELLSSRYVQVATWRRNISPLVTDSTLDSTRVPNTNVFNCYSNCHSACHGSRGWR